MLYSVVSESHPLPFLDLSGIGLQSLICGSDRACGQPPNLARASERGTVSLRLLRDVSRGERYGSREMVDEGPCGRGTIGCWRTMLVQSPAGLKRSWPFWGRFVDKLLFRCHCKNSVLSAEREPKDSYRRPACGGVL